MKSIFRDKKQVIAVVLFLVFVFLMMDLNNRLSELFRLSGQRDQMKTEVSQLRRTELAIASQVAYATSDAGVKKWAYEEGHQSMPGDNVIIPLPAGNFTPVAPTQVVPTVQKVENWEIWRMLFFGESQ
jgi:hypothetical protein